MAVTNSTLRHLALGVEPNDVDKQSITAADGSTVDATYGSEERDVIQNNVTRIGEIETALKDLGILK